MSDFPPPNVGPGSPAGGEVPAPPPWSPAPSERPPAPTLPPNVPPPAAPSGPPPTTPPPTGPPPGGPATVIAASGPPPGGFQPNVLTAEPAGKRPGMRGKIIAAAVVVAALAAGGIYIATKDDGGDSTTSATSTEVTDTTAAGDTTVAATDTTTVEVTTASTQAPDTTAVAGSVETTEVATTEAPTTTEAATTTAPTTTVFTPPAGAISLGHDVYLPLPTGWTQVNDPNSPTLISDGVTKFGVQVLSRDPGEDIVALVQEYTNTFDTVYGATSFGPTRFIGPITGIIPTNEYQTAYTTYDAGDAVGITGGIDALVRADGLSVVIDVFSPSSQPFTVPQDAYATLVTSLGAAPAQGASAPLTQHEPFRVTSVTPVVAVDGLSGFSLAPGFSIVNQGAAGSPFALVTTGVEDFSVIKVVGQADVNAVIAAAQTNLAQSYANVAYNAPTADAADRFGVLHGAFTWSGTYVDGQPSAGTINYYFDPASANAFVVFRSWFTTTGPNEPSFAEGEFMTRSLYNSITTIP